MTVLGGIDWAIVGAYLALVLGIGLYAARRARRGDRGTRDYFLAGRNAGWFVVGASLFASNIGSEHLIGLAGTAAASGLAVAQFELLAAFMLLLLGWMFVPFYLRSGVYTMPEFLERRYSAATRWVLAVISIVGYVLTKISVTVFAGGIVFESLMGIDFWTGAAIVVLVTGLYTIVGGLSAVLYTDLIQMFILVGGGIVVTVAGLQELGGWSEVRRIAGPELLSLWKPISDPNFPWTGILLGAPILGVWYWCTDQFIVQRVLSARDVQQARRGSIFAGYLKLLPLFLFVLPGVLAHCLVSSGRIQLDTPDHALPVLVVTLLPTGLRGVVVAGLLAALMSSLSTVFNSCSTLLTWDIYRKLRPRASERRLVRVGQLSTALLVALALLWIPFMKQISGQLYQYLQSVQAYIAPPIAAVFLLGILYRRVNARGALITMIVGFCIGMLRLVLELLRPSLEHAWLRAFVDLHFLHFAFLLFVLSSLLLVITSAWPSSSARFPGVGAEPRLTGFADADVEPTAASRRWDRRLSLGLCAAVGLIWLVFRG